MIYGDKELAAGALVEAPSAPTKPIIEVKEVEKSGSPAPNPPSDLEPTPSASLSG
jgi:hypothetical protein